MKLFADTFQCGWIFICQFVKDFLQYDPAIAFKVFIMLFIMLSLAVKEFQTLIQSNGVHFCLTLVMFLCYPACWAVNDTDGVRFISLVSFFRIGFNYIFIVTGVTEY